MKYIVLRFGIYWIAIALIYAGISVTLDIYFGVLTFDSIRMMIFTTIFAGVFTIRDIIETNKKEAEFKTQAKSEKDLVS